jgi:hypothetical protein
MYKRNIAVVFILVFLLGAFFQYNRSDGFIRLSKNTNVDLMDTEPENSMQDKASLPQDTFLIVYEPTDVRSTFFKHVIEQTAAYEKKKTVAITNTTSIETIDDKYIGVVLATNDLSRIVSLPQVEQYVNHGGTALFLQGIETAPAELLPDLGINAMGDMSNTVGIHMEDDFLFGAKGFSMNDPAYVTSANQVILNPSVKLHVSSAEGVPLIWENTAGRGKYVVYNGTDLHTKTNIGLLTSALTRTKADYIYPVAAVKIYCIDDFPAPVPEGNYDKIYNELHMSTADFFRNVWWPEMLANAKKYDVKYTGLIIENYNDKVKGPFNELSGREAKAGLIVYGRELLKSGGELGIHGYNHQSLAPAGYNQENLEYVPWESKADMVESLQELRSYVNGAYPGYEIRAYVPPSNILSSEGKEAVKEAFPSIKVYASLFSGEAEQHGYYQDYKRNEDGTFEIPRVTVGYVPDNITKWEGINVLNYIGIFSHFDHPDELFYEESANLSWHDMKKGIEEFLASVQKNYGWLRACTMSEAMEYLNDYFDMDYRVEQTGNEINLYCWNYRRQLDFILRTDKELDKAIGCKVEAIDDHVYLIRIENPHAKLMLKKGGEQ